MAPSPFAITYFVVIEGHRIGVPLAIEAAGRAAVCEWVRIALDARRAMYDTPAESDPAADPAPTPASPEEQTQ